MTAIDIRGLREYRGVSAEHLACYLGVSRQTVHNIETRRHEPRASIAVKVARALGTTVEELWGTRP